MNNYLKRFSPFMQKLNQHKTLAMIIAIALITGGTFLGLSMPAATATPQLICGKEEHVHTDECYKETRTLICGKEENVQQMADGTEGTEPEIAATHIHTDECYQAEKELICGKEEHAHTEECYEQAGTLKSETSDHMIAEVSYDAGVIHQDTYLTAKKLDGETEENTLKLIQKELNEKKELITVSRSYDLKLQKDEKSVVPDGKVDLSMKFQTHISADENNDSISWRLFYIDEEDNVTELTKEQTTEIVTDDENEVKEVILETADFDRYVLIGTAAVQEEVPEDVQDDAQDENETKESYPIQNFEASAGGIRVSVTAEEGAFPAGTTMKVSLVEDQDVLDMAIDAAGVDNAKAKAVDISFTDAEGKEIEPKKPIRVTMKADEISTTNEIAVVHVDDDNQASVVENSDKTAADEVVFDSDAFSTYAIVYTVDFSYGEYTYSIEGNSNILLSEVLNVLHIYKEDGVLLDVSDIKAVTFTDQSLVEVKKEGKDWILQSVKAFDTKESLTLALENGNVIEIEVVDDSEAVLDLSSFLTNVDISIDGSTVTTDKWTIQEGQPYDMTLHFAESGRNQFVDDNSSMVYTLPEGIYLQSKSEVFDITITSNGKTYTIENCKYSIDADTRKLTVNWNTDDPDFKEMTYSNNLKFDIHLTGSFDSKKSEYSFSNTVKKTVDVDNSHNADVKKSGYYDANDGLIHYTVTVSSSGSSKNIHVVDTIPSGSAISINPNSFSYSGDLNELSNTNVKNNGFDVTISEIPNGGTRTINYTASVDISKISKSGSATYDNTGNMVRIDVPDDSKQDDNISSAYVSNISFSSLGKTASSVSDTKEVDGKKYKTVTWSIEANKEKKVPLTYISDSIDSESRNTMQYSGTDITIVVTHENGTIETRKMPLKSILNSDGTGWTYKVPKGDGKASYQISYTTDVKVTSNDKSEKNKVSDNYNETTGTVVIGPDEGDKLTASKIHTNVTPEAITWKVTVNVPKDGYDSLVVTDTFNAKNYNNRLYYDELDESSIVVSGLTDSEKYVLEYTDGTYWLDGKQHHYDSGMKLTFYKDQNGNNAGVNSTSSNRTITIEYTTKNSKELREGAAAGNPDLAFHENTASIKAGNSETDVRDRAEVAESSLKKAGKKSDAKIKIKNQETGNIEAYTLYEYDLELGNVSSDQQTIYDTFDTNIMRWIDTSVLDEYHNAAEGDLLVYGGDRYYQGTSDGTKVNIENINDGIKIYVENFPKNDKGNFYPYYRIRYYLMIKDEKALLNQAASAGGVTKIHNTALWNGQSGSNDIEYKYDGLKKELISSDESSRTAQYKLTLNPNALRLNNGSDMTLVDRYENLLIDQDSFVIECNPTGEKIKPVFFEGLVQFTIPDETAVTITYEARILANAGELYSNTAKMAAYTDSVERIFNFSSSGSGGGSVTAIWLYKYEDGDESKPLAGAEFQLVHQDGEAYTVESGDHKGESIIFATGKGGMIRILLDNEQMLGGLEENTDYYLKEIKAPAGYSLSDELIPFKIVKDSTKRDHKSGALYVDDILRVSNSPIRSVDITLEKKSDTNVDIKLGGARFDVYGSDYIDSAGKINLSAKKIKTIVTSNDEATRGQASLGTLDQGTYYLIETQAPNGYVIEEAPIKIVVDASTIRLVQGTSTRTYEVTSGCATIDVTNSQGFELPHTGGTGTLKYILSGFSLMMIALLLFLRRKPDEGRSMEKG